MLKEEVTPQRQAHACRLSAKLINIRPEDLPANLREHLLGMMSQEVRGLEGYIRPGCVYLTVSIGFAATETNTVKVRSSCAFFLSNRGSEVHLFSCCIHSSARRLSVRASGGLLLRAWLHASRQCHLCLCHKDVAVCSNQRGCAMSRPADVSCCIT